MKKILIMVCFVTVFGFSAFSQSKQKLAILPFTGGTDEDGETIAELFSYDNELNNVFSPIPRTSITRAMQKERNFQRASGITDPDTIASIGKELGAQFVVAGNITILGKQKLLIISIIKIDDLQQIAGDIQIYNDIGEIANKLPEMAKNIVQATKTNRTNFDKLAIVPFQLKESTNESDADVLAQVLAIYLVNGGKYAIYPRTSSLEQVQDEYANQRNGETADENIIDIGKGTNPGYVLAGAARKLGTTRNMFNASIISLGTGLQIKGKSVDYTNLDDGIKIMQKLADELSMTEAELSGRNLNDPGIEPAVKPNDAPGLNLDTMFWDDGKKLWSIGLNAGSSFAAPWAIVSVQATISPLRYMFIEGGCDFGFIHGYSQRGDVSYHSFYPFAHAGGLVPLGKYFLWYIGAGGGYMMASYKDKDEDNVLTVRAFDAVSGMYIGKRHHYLNLGYTLRVNIKDTEKINHKAFAGYSYRF
ncbi:MAG: penicillin-binding protein activator LpoB [Treponema sp.]|jgi:TolB-like protein|nr:penicillin-binding protein activator LpoB [Treponema sp.]